MSSESLPVIGILETGFPPEPLAPRFGSYGDMMERMLGDRFRFERFDVPAGRLPSSPEACHGYVITGSSAGVYDDLPWIASLAAFLRAAKGKAKLVGICFGHQIMAQAFGGDVVKSDKGWGLGLHSYAITAPQPWMDDAATIAVPASHQDQVVALPPGAQAVGGSAFTPYGVLAYGDQPAISFQCHPEFEPAFAVALIEGRWDAPDGGADGVIASLAQPNDSARVGRWIRAFLDR